MSRQTSVDAYNKIKGGALISDRKMRIYDLLFQYGPLTCNEIFRDLLGTTEINQPNIHARLSEMREEGIVKESGERECSVTGNTVIAWDVTPNLPVELSKADRIRKQIQTLTEKLTKLHNKLRELSS